MFHFLINSVSADEVISKPVLSYQQMSWLNSDFFRWAMILFIIALLLFTTRQAFKSEAKLTKKKHS